MGNALEPGRETFDQKMAVRKAIEEAKIPFTYVSANCFAGYFAGSLSQMQTLIPPTHQVTLYGDGNVKGDPPHIKLTYKLICIILLFFNFQSKCLNSISDRSIYRDVYEAGFNYSLYLFFKIIFSIK